MNVLLYSYAEELDRPFLASVKVSQVAGFAFGLSEGMTFSMFCSLLASMQLSVASATPADLN
jgi:hypothetical protein